MKVFKVTVAGGAVIDLTGNYSITDGGVLTVVPDGGNRLSFSPIAWERVEHIETTKSERPRVTVLQ